MQRAQFVHCPDSITGPAPWTAFSAGLITSGSGQTA